MTPPAETLTPLRGTAHPGTHELINKLKLVSPSHVEPRFAPVVTVLAAVPLAAHAIGTRDDARSASVGGENTRARVSND